MFRAFTFAAFALVCGMALTPGEALAQFGGMGGRGGGMGGMMMMSNQRQDDPRDFKTYPVKVSTVSGQAVSGSLRVAKIHIMCDLGQYAVKPDKIKEVRINLGQGDPNSQLIYGPGGTNVPGTVVTRSGEEINGIVGVPASGWVVETDLGSLTLHPGTLKTLAITGPGQDEPPPDAVKPAPSQPAGEKASDDPTKRPAK